MDSEACLKGTQWIFHHVWYLPPGTPDTQPAQETFRKGSVLVKGHTVHSIHPPEVPLHTLLNLLPDAHVIQLPDTYVLSPGLIEQHCHGGFGCDIMAASLQKNQHFLRFLPSLGITGVLPTLITASIEKMLSALNALEEVAHLSQSQRARMLGIHLEGPFLNPQYRGAHPAQALQACDMTLLEKLLSPSVKLVTLAPELPNALPMIKALVAKGIRVSIGHTNATSDETRAALEAGATCFTHALNAMRGLHHRSPSVTHTLLSDTKAYSEFIGDGVHLHPETIALLLKSRPRQKHLLVSDCMCLSGLPQDTTHTFGGETVGFQEGAIRQISTGTIVGSAMFVSQQIPQLVRQGLTSFEQALRMASESIAQHLGYEGMIGRIQEGLLADLVLWDRHSMTPLSTWVNGVCLVGQEHWLTHTQANPHIRQTLKETTPQGFSNQSLQPSRQAVRNNIPTQVPSLASLDPFQPTTSTAIKKQAPVGVVHPSSTQELASGLEALIDFDF